MGISKFVLYFFLFSVCVFAIPYGVQKIVAADVISEYYVPLFLFLFVLTTIVYVMSFLGIKKGGADLGFSFVRRADFKDDI